jgi:pantetheine-phosphate adenylyltransferase
MITVIYPGTFDPVTRGHEDIVRRAAGLFDQVIVGVADSRGKQPFFTLEERVALAREVLAPYRNVSVQGFNKLLRDFALENNARIILRGLRAASDFEYEFQMAGMNRSLIPDVETVFMTPENRYMFISATMVREIASLGGDVGQFVQPVVKERMNAKVKQLGA